MSRVPHKGIVICPHPHKGSKEPIARRYQLFKDQDHTRVFIFTGPKRGYPKSFKWLKKWLQYTGKMNETS